MAKEDIRFEDFLMTVEPGNLDFVIGLHGFLLQSGCEVKIQSAKSGYVVSYYLAKRAVLNYVFRKKGLTVRIYGDHIGHYNDLLETLPDGMVKTIEKAPICKRLADPAKCNSRCPMGYIFTLRGSGYQKCRYNGFLFLVDESSGPYIKKFLENEIKERTA